MRYTYTTHCKEKLEEGEKEKTRVRERRYMYTIAIFVILMRYS